MTMTPMMPVPGAAWTAPFHADKPPLSERLVRALEAHAAAEAESLESYGQLSALEDDPIARLLIQLVVDDEQRHHTLLRRMTTTLRDELDGGHSPDALPAAPGQVPADAETALALTRALIREEHEGARYVRHLARQEPDLYDGVYALLLETIARDSEKHERLLRYLLRRLETRVHGRY